MIFNQNFERTDSVNEYHSNKDYLSKSDLSMVLQRPARFKRRLMGLEKSKDTKSRVLGSYTHSLILTPELAKRDAAERIIARKEKDRDHCLYSLSDTDVDRSERMSEAVSNHGKASELLGMPGQAEMSYYWFDEEFGLYLKCRPDFRTDNHRRVVDIKTTRDVTHRKFRRQAFDLDYDMSVALTFRGLESVTGMRPENYFFVTVENGVYPDVVVYEASREMVESGEEKLRKAVDLVHRCARSDWPVNPEGDNLELKPFNWSYVA